MFFVAQQGVAGGVVVGVNVIPFQLWHTPGEIQVPGEYRPLAVAIGVMVQVIVVMSPVMVMGDNAGSNVIDHLRDVDVVKQESRTVGIADGNPGIDLLDVAAAFVLAGDFSDQGRSPFGFDLDCDSINL